MPQISSVSYYFVFLTGRHGFDRKGNSELRWKNMRFYFQIDFYSLFASEPKFSYCHKVTDLTLMMLRCKVWLIPGRVHSIRKRWFVFAEGKSLWRQYDVSMTPECSDLDWITSDSVIFMAILGTTEHIDVIGKRVYVTHSFIDNVNFLP